MGPWARAFLGGAGHTSDGVTELRVEPSLITARVNGRSVSLSAPPIPAGVWAAIEGHVTTDRQSEQLAQLLEHTWEEPLVPSELVRVGAEEDVAAVVRAVAEEVDRDPSALLRFRGYDARPAVDHDDAWQARGSLPPLPPPARRPPDSVPKRFGTSGVRTADGDLVETLIRAYRAFGD
ncbi:MAG TPA: hypothetical protein VFU56_01990 [Gaiellaceae bacterium]|nr:hypothetical protein [Gaiellaceae bacterium]